MPIQPKHWWNCFGVPQFDLNEEGRKWRIQRQEWRDRFTIHNIYGNPDLDDEEFLHFVADKRIPEELVPKAMRVITPDRAQHLALTYNGFMYRSTIQKRAQLEDVIYWGYLDALRCTLFQCLAKEGGESYRFCRPLYRKYLDALAPITNFKFLWEEEDVDKQKELRLRTYQRWNAKKKKLWDEEGFAAIEMENEQIF